MSKDIYLNEEIRADEVRCIGDDGQVYGIISKDEALQIAQREGLDLVLIAPDAKPVSYTHLTLPTTERV